MSLILEALRRSEAERRLGQAPDLLSPMPGARRRQRPAWLRAALATAAAIAVAGGGWWLGQRGNAATEPGPAAASEVSSPPAAPSPPAPSLPASPPPQAPVQPPAAAAAHASAAASMPAPAPRPGPAAPIAVAEPSPEATVAAPTLPSGPASATDLAELRARLAPAATAAPPPTAAEPEPTRIDTLPPVSSLPSERRAALPPLRLTMHVFNEAPERRFVILDGRRQIEGATVGNGAVLAEIRRDGVVLELDGRRVLLPRP